ncbi:MAG: glycosyltransferase family 39 protein [Burkholderiales bacterium]|nr:glycosyltransferase family 39 protein [Anaerolineae bacterium]
MTRTSILPTLEIPEHELPHWMRQARRGFDWGLLIVFAFSVIAAWPFILQPGLPRTNASENYAFRTANYAAAIQEGYLYPRWSPHVLGGYGAPIPNFYPPAAPYSAALIQVLFTNDAVLASRWIYILAFCLAGPAVYALVRRRADAEAGVLAAILYLFCPYVGLTAPHLLGDLPGALGLALLPALLWRVDRLLLRDRSPDFLLAVLMAALLLLTDIRIACVGLVLAAILIGWHSAFQDRRAPWKLALAALALGILLASFFIFPALLEQSAVRWQFEPAAPGTNGALGLTLSGLFTPANQIDTGELLPVPQLTIGAVGLLFTLLGSVGIGLAMRQRAYMDVRTLYLAAGGIIIVIALLIFPHEIWMLGPIMLCLSVGGSGALCLARRFVPRWQRLALPAFLIVALIGSLTTWLAPRWPAVSTDTSAEAQIRYEQQGYGLAVMPPHAPAPITIASTLDLDRSLISSYLSGNVTKIAMQSSQPNAGLQISVLAHTGHADRFQLRLPATSTLEILTAYFPGWEATLNGAPVELSEDEQTGLMQVTLPAIRDGILQVSLGPTPTRTQGWALTWLALGLVMLFTIRRLRAQKQGGIFYDDLHFLSKPQARLLAVILLSFGLIIGLFAIPTAPLRMRPSPGYALEGSISLRSRTDSGLSLLAYRVSSAPDAQYRPGEAVPLTLYWHTLRSLPENYRAQVVLIDTLSGTRWYQSELRDPGDYPTRRWNTNQYVRDNYLISTPPEIPGGTYLIAIDVYTCAPDCLRENRLTFFDTIGGYLGQTLVLPTLVTIAP